MSETIEKKVSGAILQEKQIVTIGGVDYEIAPPSAAVWIKASDIASEAKVESLNEEDLIGEIFRNAGNYLTVCRIVARMILGVSNPSKTPFLNIKSRKSDLEQLTNKLSLAPPSDIKKAMNVLFAHHEAGFFFGTLTFLNDITMTQPTRTETTASGQ